MVIVENRICPNCNNQIIFKETPNLTHYGKLVCVECGRWFKWVSNPDKKTRSKTSQYKNKDILAFYGLAQEICFFCLRKKDQLGKCETITRDHIIELQESGEDSPNNIQLLCTSCHKLKNWARTYINWHHKEDESDE